MSASLRRDCARLRRAAWERGLPLKPTPAEERLAAKLRPRAGRLPWARSWLAQHELRAGRPAACLAELVWAENGAWTALWRAEAQRALTESGSPGAAEAAEARRLGLAGRPAEAASLFGRALALRPGDAGLHERRAACWTFAGRHARAAADWARAARLSPGAGAELGLAKALHSLGLFARAGEAAARAAAHAPSSAEARRLRAESLRLSGRWAEALSELEAAVLLDPSDAAARSGATRARAVLARPPAGAAGLRARGLHAEALDAFLAESDFSGASKSWLALGRPDEALRCAEKWARRRPGFEPSFAAGRCALIAGRPEAALRALTAALRLKKTSYEAVVWKARALRQLGRPVEALALWRRAAALRPGAEGPRRVAAELGGDELREASARAGFDLDRALPGLAEALECDPRWLARYDPAVLRRFHAEGLEAAARGSTGAVRGRALRLLGRTALAAAQLRRAAKIPSERARALAWLGELELSLGRRRGLALLARAAAAAPRWAWPRLCRALWLRGSADARWEIEARAAAAAEPGSAPARALRGVLDRSATDLDAAAALDPLCPAFPCLAGLALYAAGRRPEALEHAERSLRVNPEAADVFHAVMRAELDWGSGAAPRPWDWTLVLPQLEVLLAREPDAAWVRACRAVCVGGTNTKAGLAQAVADFTKAIALDPARAWFWTYRGRMRIYQDDAGGLDDTRRALELDGGSSWLWAWQGAVKLKLRDLDGARADLDRAVRLDPYYDRSYWWLGMVEARAGRWEASVAEYSRGIALLPGFALFHFDRAAARVRLEDLAGAAADLTTAADLDYKLVGRLGLLRPAELAAALAKAGPRDGRIAGWRGQARIQAGDIRGALADLAACRRLLPAWFWARVWSAEAFLHAGLLEEAVAEAGEALRLRAMHPAAFSARGRALARLGRLDEAEADLGAAVAADVKAAGDFSWRGRVRLESGRPAQALADLDWALRLDPLEAAPTLLLRARARAALGDAAGALADAKESQRLVRHQARGEKP